MIDCRLARQHLAPEPGPRATSPDVEAAFRHYQGCRACQDFFETHRRLAGLVRRAGRGVHAPPDLAPRILAAVSRHEASATTALRSRRNLWLGGVAVAAAAVLTLWLGPPVGSDPLTARPFVEQALAVDGPARATPALAPGPLDQWFRSQQIHGFEIPDIEQARMSAAVDFETPTGFQVTYIMVPDTRLFGGVNESDIMTMSSDGWEVAMWVENGTARAVISQMPRGDLLTIAEQCKNKRIL